MTDRRSDNAIHAAIRDWHCFDAETQAELAYLKAERTGIKVDNRPLNHTLKVEEFSYTAGPTGEIYSLIRLKGRWLSKIFPPNTRVVVEKVTTV